MQKLLIILAIVVAGCKDAAEEEKALVKSIQPASTPKLTDLNGSDINLETYKGKAVFLNFWATWCKPCIAEMPWIKNAQDKLRDSGVVFLFASDETPEQIRQFKESTGLDLHFVRALNMEELNITALPTTYIYNSIGKRVYIETGVAKWDDSLHIEWILKLRNQQ